MCFLMSYVDEKALFDQEMDTYYAGLNTDITYLEDELHRESSEHPEWLPYQRKARGYQWMAENTRVNFCWHQNDSTGIQCEVRDGSTTDQ